MAKDKALDTELCLPDHIIDGINNAVGKHMQAEARARKGVAPPGSPTSAIAWLANIGGLLSKWLPIFLNVLNELGAMSSVEPTIEQFAAKLHEKCCGGGHAVPVPGAAAAVKPG